MSNTNNNNKIKISKLKYFYFILVLSILLISGTYAYQYITTTNSNTTGMGGCFNVNYTGQNIATTDLATTTNYQNGSKTTVTLSKHSSCKLYTEANIYLKTNNTTTAPIESIQALKYKVFNGSSQISEGTITTKNDYLLATVPLTNTSTTYTVYLYIDANLSIGNYDEKTYSGYVYATSNQTSTIEGNYLVNFDTNNGENLSLSKTVTNGQPYGWLPTPSKPGYTFKGWYSNLAPDLNETNYNIRHYGNRTTHEIKNDGSFDNLTNQTYIRINGNTSTSNIDTAWDIVTKDYFEVQSGKKYNLSFYVRSANAAINQYFSTATGDMWRTFILWDNETKTYLSSNKSFSNDGNWHLISDEITVPSGVNTAKISIGYDTPNIYGTNSYIDVANIQLSANESANHYKIVSDTIFSINSNHTLCAKWEPAKYTVKFDANGGTVNIAKKEVTYGSTYENLPTPVLNGRTFKGWNGKNLINVSNHNVTFTNTYYVENTPTPKYMLKSDKTYTLSFNHKVNSASRNIFASVGYGVTGFQRDIQSSSYYTGTGTSVTTFTTPSTFNYNPPYVSFRFVRMSSTGDANVDISNVQLEEGPSATAYEPYFVTNSTTVTQDEDHTLTAIWE